MFEQYNEVSTIEKVADIRNLIDALSKLPADCRGVHVKTLCLCNTKFFSLKRRSVASSLHPLYLELVRSVFEYKAFFSDNRFSFVIEDKGVTFIPQFELEGEKKTEFVESMREAKERKSKPTGLRALFA